MLGLLWYNRRPPTNATLFAAKRKIILDLSGLWWYNTYKKSEIPSLSKRISKMAYTATQETKIRESAPINKAKADKLASEFGVTLRSVISKAISMKVEYIKENRPAAQPVVRKVEVVRSIEKALGIQANSLVNATARDLAALLKAVS